MYKEHFFSYLKLVTVLLILFTSCSRDDEESNALNPGISSLPVLTTNAAINITQNSVMSGGRISSDGGSSILSKGVCWSISPSPTIANTNTNDGSGTSDFSSYVSGLFPGTTYYVRGYASNKNGNGYGQQVIFTTPEVLVTGINYAGGIIFYLDSTGMHGIVCSETDQSISASWGCSNTQIPGADGVAIGTGMHNTQEIIGACSTPGIAAKICDSLIVNGYSDWFLPSKEELKQMYANLKTIGVGDFSNSPYWSSSEMTSTIAWEVFFDNGLTQGTGKNNPASVRAVRVF